MLKKLKNVLVFSMALATVMCFGAVGTASAETTHYEFACIDSTTKLVISKPDSKHFVTVSCKSKAQITYPSIPQAMQPSAVDVTCPGAQVTNVNAEVLTQLKFNCLNRAGPSSDYKTTPTKDNPKVKQTDVTTGVCLDKTTVSGSLSTNCPVPAITDKALQGGKCAKITNCDLIKDFINPAINLASALVGVVVVISIVIGGIQYGSSAGDPQKVSAARTRIRNAIIALIAFVLLYAMLNFLIPGGLIGNL